MRVDWQRGEVLAPNYEILAVLGEGAMGRVYEALDRDLDRRVAIKVAWPEVAGPTLRSEARALAAVRHPSLPTVYTLGAHAGGDFIVMERVYGISLEQLLEQRTHQGEPLSVDEVLRILIDLADGLRVLHGAGMAHRDVKPANVMLTPDRRVVLMDLGLHVPEASVAAQPGAGGSPAYMPSEALLGQVQPGGGPKVDIYGFGVLAYELLTGKLPRDADNIHALVVAMRQAVTPVREHRPEVPEALSALLSACLSVDPGARPEDMEEVTSTLRGISTRGTTVQAGPVRVLVVDDDPDVARVLAFYAKRALPEAEILFARDGEEALAQLRAAPPQVMLLDLHMPRMNGVEVCMFMRGSGLAEDCRVIAVSAGAQENDRVLLHQLGIAHILLKGPDLGTQLVAVLRSTSR